MDFKDLTARAAKVRDLYARHEAERYGRPWSREEVMLGFVGDVGDLAKLALAAEAVREISESRAKLEHELADCLWSLMTLARLHDVDLEASFLETMDDLEARLG